MYQRRTAAHFQRIEIAINLVTASLLFLLLIGFGFDLVDFLQNSEDYHLDYATYGNRPEGFNREYVVKKLIALLLTMGCLLIITWRMFKKENVTIKRVSRFVVALFWTSAIIGFYKMMTSGFDH